MLRLALLENVMDSERLCACKNHLNKSMKEIDWNLSDAQVLFLFRSTLIRGDQAYKGGCRNAAVCLACLVILSGIHCELLTGGGHFFATILLSPECFYPLKIPWCFFHISFARKGRDWRAGYSRAVTRWGKNKSSSFATLNSCQLQSTRGLKSNGGWSSTGLTWPVPDTMRFQHRMETTGWLILSRSTRIMFTWHCGWRKLGSSPSHLSASNMVCGLCL